MAFQKADAKCLVWGLSRKKENGHDRVMRIDKRTASTLVEIANGGEIGNVCQPTSTLRKKIHLVENSR